MYVNMYYKSSQLIYSPKISTKLNENVYIVTTKAKKSIFHEFVGVSVTNY